MTQSFDEWFEKNGELYRKPTSDERYLFEAGAQSKQAEIDELQARIDEVLDYVGDDFTDYYTGVMIESIHEILKGTTNEQ